MKQGKPSITFLVGMPAVGKSTFIEQMGYDSNPDVYIHSTDDIIMEIVDSDSRYKTYDDFFKAGDGLPFPQTPFAKQVLPILYERFQGAVMNNMDIVVDMVNESKYKRNQTLKDIDIDDFIVRAVVFGHEPWKAQSPRYIDSIVDAVAERARKTGKSVPENVLRERMFPAYEVPTREEGFDQINFVDPLNPLIRV
jgi:GTPase SAR1 family protein